MDPQERAKIGEGDLWKGAGRSERHEVGEVEAFTPMVSEISQTLVALRQEGSVHLQTQGSHPSIPWMDCPPPSQGPSIS